MNKYRENFLYAIWFKAKLILTVSFLLLSWQKTLQIHFAILTLRNWEYFLGVRDFALYFQLLLLSCTSSLGWTRQQVHVQPTLHGQAARCKPSRSTSTCARGRHETTSIAYMNMYTIRVFTDLTPEVLSLYYYSYQTKT